MAGRATLLGRSAAIIFVVAFVIAGIWVAGLDGHHVTFAVPDGASNPALKRVAVVPGGWLTNFRAHRVLWLIPVAAVLGAAATWALLGVRLAGAAFLASSVTLAATILTAGVALFPFLMPSSTHPNQG